MSRRSNRGKKSAKRPREHVRLRHRTVLPEVPREAREDAISVVRQRHPTHANSMLLIARGGAGGARRFDTLMRFIDWAFAVRDAFANIPWPRPIDEGKLFLPGDATEKLDVARLINNARAIQRLLESQAQVTETLQAFRNAVAETEVLRDVDIDDGGGGNALRRPPKDQD